MNTLRATTCHERTRLVLKNHNALWTTAAFVRRHNIAPAANNLRVDLSAPNELERRPGEGTPRPVELIELRNGKWSAAWFRYSSRFRRCIRGNPHGF